MIDTTQPASPEVIAMTFGVTRRTAKYWLWLRLLVRRGVVQEPVSAWHKWRPTGTVAESGER